VGVVAPGVAVCRDNLDDKVIVCNPERPDYFVPVTVEEAARAFLDLRHADYPELFQRSLPLTRLRELLDQG
jgi:hypothetical protein